MTTKRSQQINLDATPYYHVMTRCVRRSYLCGVDAVTQKDYTHRKAWIVSRMKYLANIFAIKICAYAVLSNHYHLVLQVDEYVTHQWSDEDISQRWGGLFPTDAKTYQHLPEKIKLWRERLCSISWFMRCLNEHIARAVNEEDQLTGRFWESRFKTQALLDDSALLSAMVYVDLNPIRAGIAKSTEESEFTSIYERIKRIEQQLRTTNSESGQLEINKKYSINVDQLKQPSTLVPFSIVDQEKSIHISFKLSDYLTLVDNTGRMIREGKPSGAIPETLLPILDRLQIRADAWISHVKNLETEFHQAVGSEVLLINFSKIRKRIVRGVGVARKVFRL